MPKYGHWKTTWKLNPEEALGFCYLIVNKKDGRFYIGKKQYRVMRGKRKGKPHRWDTYMGSSLYVKKEIKELGIKNFEFYILEEYWTLGGLSWAEIWSLVTCRVPENNDVFYNRRIDKCSWKSNETVTTRHERRLTQIINKYKKGKK